MSKLLVTVAVCVLTLGCLFYIFGVEIIPPLVTAGGATGSRIETAFIY